MWMCVEHWQFFFIFLNFPFLQQLEAKNKKNWKDRDKQTEKKYAQQNTSTDIEDII